MTFFFFHLCVCVCLNVIRARSTVFACARSTFVCVQYVCVRSNACLCFRCSLVPWAATWVCVPLLSAHTCGLSSLIEQKRKSAYTWQFTSSNLYLHYTAPQLSGGYLWSTGPTSNDYFHCWLINRLFASHVFKGFSIKKKVLRGQSYVLQ